MSEKWTMPEWMDPYREHITTSHYGGYTSEPKITVEEQLDLSGDGRGMSNTTKTEIALIKRLHDAGYCIPTPPAQATGLKAWDETVEHIDELQAKCDRYTRAGVEDGYLSQLAVDFHNSLAAIREARSRVEALRVVKNPGAVPGLIAAARKISNSNHYTPHSIGHLDAQVDAIDKEPEADA